MHSHAEPQSLLARRGGPCANNIAMWTICGCIPRMVFRIPCVEAVMVIGKRDEDSGAGVLVAANQLVRIPVQECPLGAEVLVSEARRRPVMFNVVPVLGLSFDIHIARVPVAGFGHALRAPVRPDAEFCVLVPFRCFVLQQGIPSWFIRAFSGEVWER